MSIRTTFKVKGMNQFVRNAQSVGKKKETEIHQEIARSTLRVERRAKKYAPWDTGWLSNTIYSMMIAKNSGEVIAPAEYAVWIENGTRKMMAQPFLFPALEADWALLQRNIKKILGG